MRQRVTYLAYAAGWALVRRLPERAAYLLFDLVADVLWRRRVAPVRQLERNLHRVIGPDAPAAALRAVSRSAMRSYLRYWCDAFRLPDWSPEQILARVRCENEHYLRDPIAAGRGVIAAMPHTGNWDAAGAWAVVTGAPVTTVAERLRPERLFARFLAFREALGMEILPLTGAGNEVFPVLVRRIKDGRLVPLLADRDLRASGIEVTFFGERMRMPPGPALLALTTKAPLHPVTIRYEGARPHRIVIHFHDAVVAPTGGSTREKVTAMTQQVAGVFEAAISAHPEDWHMLQPLWPADAETG